VISGSGAKEQPWDWIPHKTNHRVAFWRQNLSHSCLKNKVKAQL